MKFRLRPQNAVQFVHDPCVIKHRDFYYVFSTGHGVPIRRSRDLKQWEVAGRVFAEDCPAWAKDAVPGSIFPWAPDIAYLNGKYCLYYSVSSFGRNRSVIGMATNRTLDPNDRDYAWKDEGKVFESFPTDNYNAIDSNVLAVGRDRLAFVFGSFWSGIKYMEADPATGKPRPGATVQHLASREMPDAIEAPFLYRRGNFYYLFASYDTCCRGVQSTYNIRVGRSKAVEGPYVDKAGKPMRDAGGTLISGTDGRYIGTGHCAVLKDGRRDLLFCHYYDRDNKGVPTLLVRPLDWDRDGWPTPGKPIE